MKLTFALGLAGAAVAVVAGLLIGLNPVLAASIAVAVMLASLATLNWYRSRNNHQNATSTTAVLVNFAVAAAAVLLLIQAVPYGRDHANPPITGGPQWATPRTRELMVNACYGCHSNEVEWPWYSNIAPMSWAITDHVDEGRSKVNFSEFDTYQDEAEESIETILEGSMPPAYYTRFGLHPEANLSNAEIAELVAGLRATPGFNEQDEQDEQDERDEEDEPDERDDD